MNIFYEFKAYITSNEYILKINQALNESFLYDSPLSGLFFDLNRIAFNKPHFWIRTLLERISLVFDPVQHIFLWTVPTAFIGFSLFYKKLNWKVLFLTFVFLIFAAVKGTGGWLLFLPWILFYQSLFLFMLARKYVFKK